MLLNVIYYYNDKKMLYLKKNKKKIALQFIFKKQKHKSKY